MRRPGNTRPPPPGSSPPFTSAARAWKFSVSPHWRPSARVSWSVTVRMLSAVARGSGAASTCTSAPAARAVATEAREDSAVANTGGMVNLLGFSGSSAAMAAASPAGSAEATASASASSSSPGTLITRVAPRRPTSASTAASAPSRRTSIGAPSLTAMAAALSC